MGASGTCLRTLSRGLAGIIAAILYLLNPDAGPIEFIAGNIRVIGNLSSRPPFRPGDISANTSGPEGAYGSRSAGAG